MSMSIRDRGEAIARAENALRHLEQHPATTVDQLGQARWQLNNAYNSTAAAFVYDAVEATELIVLEVYGGIPDSESTNP